MFPNPPMENYTEFYNLLSFLSEGEEGLIGNLEQISQL